MSKVQKFRKLPVVIEAMHWDGTAEDAVPIIQWILDGQGKGYIREYQFAVEVSAVWQHSYEKCQKMHNK